METTSIAPQPSAQREKIRKELQRLRSSTTILILFLLGLLGVLIGYYATGFVSPFKNIAYAEDAEMHFNVSWETEFPAITRVEYGTSRAYLNSTNITSFYELAHDAKIEGLLPGKDHYFRLVATDEHGRTHYSSFYPVK